MFFEWKFFNSIKVKNRLRKEINSISGKGMSNIYLTVTIEKKWRTQNLDFKRLKISSPGHLLGSFNLPKCHWIFKLFVVTLKSKGCFQKLEPTSPSSFFWPTPKFYGLMLPTPKFRLTPSAPFFFDPYHLRINLAHAIHEAARTMPPVLPEPATLFGALTRRRRAEARVSGKLRLQGGQA